MHHLFCQSRAYHLIIANTDTTISSLANFSLATLITQESIEYKNSYVLPSCGFIYKGYAKLYSLEGLDTPHDGTTQFDIACITKKGEVVALLPNIYISNYTRTMEDYSQEIEFYVSEIKISWKINRQLGIKGDKDIIDRFIEIAKFLD